MSRKKNRKIAEARRYAAARIAGEPLPAAGAPPDVPPPPPDAAARRRRWIELFWLAVRLAIPVVGVLVLDWPQMMAALLYIFECWLFVLSRIVAENLLRKSEGAFREFSTVGLLLRSVIGVGFVLAMFGGVSIAFLIDHFFLQEWEELSRGGWRDPLFLISLGLVLVQQGQDLARFTAAWRQGRSKQQKRFNELEKVSRIGVLFACNFLIVLGANFGYGGVVQVIAMSALMFWIESSDGWRAQVPAASAERPPAGQPRTS